MKNITILAAIMILGLLGLTSQGAVVITTATGSGADTFVGNDTNKPATNNYGTQPSIDLRIAANSRAHLGYVRFDISSAGGNLTGAQLQIYVSQGGAARTWNVYGLINNDTDDAWGETTITYNNAPGMLATTAGNYLVDATKLTLLGTLAVPAATGLVTSTTAALPLDTFLASDTNGLVTLVMIPTGGDRQFYVAAKEGLAANPTWSAPTLTLPNASVLNARKPVPFNNNASVLPTLTQLSWTNPDPNAVGGVITCDVFLGTTEPNALLANYGLTKIATGISATTATIPFVLTAPQKYYWVVDCYDTSKTPALRPGVAWNFTTVAMPVITGNPANQAKFVSESAVYTANFTSLTALTAGWPKWYKKGSPDQEVNNTLNPRVTISTTNVDSAYTSTLTISNVVTGDEGSYYCEVRNNAGTVATTAANFVFKALRAHWPFDGNADDTSGYGLGGTLTGTTAFVPGQIGQALQFNGTNAYVDMPDGFSDFTAGLTFSVWAKPGTVTWYDRFMDFSNGENSDNIFVSRVSNTNNLIFQVFKGPGSAGSVTATGAIAANEWQLFVVTMNQAGDVVIYKNGLSIQTGTVSLPNIITRTSNFIGKSNWPDDGLYAGLMDDVRIYNYAVSADDVANLYSSAVGNFCRTRPAHDYNGDCKVDIGDCIFFAGYWLDCGMYPVCP